MTTRKSQVNQPKPVMPEDNPPRTEGEQPSGATDPRTEQTRDERDRPGADATVGTPEDGVKAATSFPTLPKGGAEVHEDELEAQRKREGVVVGDGGVTAQPLFILRGADVPGEISPPKVDPALNQTNVELPTGDVKVDMGSKESTHDVVQTAAERLRTDPGFAAGYAYAMKQARGEI